MTFDYLDVKEEICLNDYMSLRREGGSTAKKKDFSSLVSKMWSFFFQLAAPIFHFTDQEAW